MPFRERPADDPGCMFCFERDAMNKEHVFPESLGGSFSIYQPCTSCNSTLGTKFDSLLVDHPLIQMRRNQLKVKGKRGTVPDPFKNGELIDSPISSKPISVKKTVHPTSGQWGATIIPTFSEFIDASDKKVLSGVFGDEAAARKWFSKELERQNVAVGSEQEFEALYSASVKVGTIEKPNVNYRIEVDLFKYRQAIIKIAYEMAFFWLGPEWLNDGIARKYRKVLRSEPKLGPIRIHGGIWLAPPESIRNVSSWMGLKSHEHSATLFVLDDKAAIMLTIFDVFYAVLEVSNTARNYSVQDMRSEPAPVLLLDTIAKSSEFSNIAKLFLRKSSEGS